MGCFLGFTQAILMRLLFLLVFATALPFWFGARAMGIPEPVGFGAWLMLLLAYLGWWATHRLPEATAARNASPRPAPPVPAAPAPPVGPEPAKRCPDCGEHVLAAARICRFCRLDFPPAEADTTDPADASAPADALATPDTPMPPPRPGLRRCARCHKDAGLMFNTCPHCSADYPSPAVRPEPLRLCAACGRTAHASFRVCPHCRTEYPAASS